MKKEQEFKSIKLIGDIEVLANADFAKVTVDQKTILTIPRHNSGLSEFANVLISLAKVSQ